MDGRHGLFIPAGDGLMEILHSDFAIDAVAYLADKRVSEAGQIVSLPIDVDGERDCILVFAVSLDSEDEEEETNDRARQVIAQLTGIHIHIPGPAVVLGLSGERTLQVMRGVD